MDSILRFAIAVGLALGVQSLLRGLGRRRVATKLRKRYATDFDPRSAQRELDEYVAIVRGALPQLRSEPIDVPPPAVPDDLCERWLSAAVSAAAERFGVPLSELEWRFIAEPLVPAAAGCAWTPSRTEVRREGDHYIVSPRDGPRSVWTVEVADRYRSDPEVAFVTVGHELAHVALLSRGVRVSPPQRNERLTDVAAALAGFGGLMLRVAQRERWTENQDTLSLKVGAVGYLHRDAIQYLCGRHLAPGS